METLIPPGSIGFEQGAPHLLLERPVHVGLSVILLSWPLRLLDRVFKTLETLIEHGKARLRRSVYFYAL